MTAAPGRRPRKMLTAEQKYDLWVRMLTGQITQAEAAAEEAGVDRSVVSRLRAVARDGKVAALGASRRGRPRQSRAEASEAAAMRAEVERLGRTVVEQAVELAVLLEKTQDLSREIRRNTGAAKGCCWD
ncbi:MAG: hypothetical protein OXM54_03880 [Acidimicrobiaceae bacterium]|nr:hypothetical protein [Acidimicrobiaceae bacterium]